MSEEKKKTDWAKYRGLKKNADKILQLDYEDFVKVLTEDYEVGRDSDAFQKAITIWKRMRGLY